MSGTCLQQVIMFGQIRSNVAWFGQTWSKTWIAPESKRIFSRVSSIRPRVMRVITACCAAIVILTHCGGEVRHGVTTGVAREMCATNTGGEVRHGVTSGVSYETSKT